MRTDDTVVYAPPVCLEHTRAAHETPAQQVYFLSLPPALENRAARRLDGIRLTPRHYRVLDLLLLAGALESTQLRIGAGFPLGLTSYASHQRVLAKMDRTRLIGRLP